MIVNGAKCVCLWLMTESGGTPTSPLPLLPPRLLALPSLATRSSRPRSMYTPSHDPQRSLGTIATHSVGGVLWNSTCAAVKNRHTPDGAFWGSNSFELHKIGQPAPPSKVQLSVMLD